MIDGYASKGCSPKRIIRIPMAYEFLLEDLNELPFEMFELQIVNLVDCRSSH